MLNEYVRVHVVLANQTRKPLCGIGGKGDRGPSAAGRKEEGKGVNPAMSTQHQLAGPQSAKGDKVER